MEENTKQIIEAVLKLPIRKLRLYSEYASTEEIRDKLTKVVDEIEDIIDRE